MSEWMDLYIVVTRCCYTTAKALTSMIGYVRLMLDYFAVELIARAYEPSSGYSAYTIVGYKDGERILLLEESEIVKEVLYCSAVWLPSAEVKEYDYRIRTDKEFDITD